MVLDPAPAGWNLEPGTRNLEPGTWNLEPWNFGTLEPWNNRTIEQLNNRTIELDISTLPSGIYFIRMSIGNELIVTKIVKL